MGNSTAKLLLEKELFTLERFNENNYKDSAYDSYRNLLGMLESFLQEKVISKWTYKKYKKKLLKYDDYFRVLFKKQEA